MLVPKPKKAFQSPEVHSLGLFHGGDTAITVPPRSGPSHRRHWAKRLLPVAFSRAPRGRDGALRPILAQRSAKHAPKGGAAPRRAAL